MGPGDLAAIFSEIVSTGDVGLKVPYIFFRASSAKFLVILVLAASCSASRRFYRKASKQLTVTWHLCSSA